MHNCGIGKSGDSLSKENFIVLMLVRIGAAPTQLIQKLHERFRTLDRKKEGRIAYDDIVYGRKKHPTHKQVITRMFMRSFSVTSSMVQGGLRRMSTNRNRQPLYCLQPEKVHPISVTMSECCPTEGQELSELPWEGGTDESPVDIEKGGVVRPQLVQINQEATQAVVNSLSGKGNQEDGGRGEHGEDSDTFDSDGGGNPDRRGSGGDRESSSSESEDNERGEGDDMFMPMQSGVTIDTTSSRRSSGGMPRRSKVVAYQLDMQKRHALLSTIRKGKNKKLPQIIKEYCKLTIKDSHFVLFCIW